MDNAILETGGQWGELPRKIEPAKFCARGMKRTGIKKAGLHE